MPERVSVPAVEVKIADVASSLNLLPAMRCKPILLIGDSGGDFGGGVGGRSMSLGLEKIRPSDNLRGIGKGGCMNDVESLNVGMLGTSMRLS